MPPTNASDRRRRRWPWVILGLVLLAAGGLALLHIRGCGAERELERRLEALRARGMPTNFEEYLEWRDEPPPQENMALVVLDACERLNLTEGEGPDRTLAQLGLDSELGVRWSPQKLHIAEQYLGHHAQALSLARKASELNRGCYPLPFPQPATDYTDHMSCLRNVARLLRESAVYNAQHGRTGKAADDVAAAIRLAASMGDRPLAIEAIMASTLDWLATEGTELVLGLAEMTSDGLGRLRRELAQEDARVAHMQDIPGERAFALDALQDRQASNLRAATRRFSRRWFLDQVATRTPGGQARDTLRLLDLFRKGQEVRGLPPLARLKAMEAEQARCAAEHEGGPFLGAEGLPSLWHAFCMTEEQVSGAHARLRAAGAALAVEQWRLEHGGWPESLEDLVPELLESVPTDPFTGEALRYRQTDEGVRVYSVGIDQTDQDGLAQEERTVAECYPEDYDLPFRLLNPQLRGGRTASFREEIDPEEHWGISLATLKQYGYGPEELKELNLLESEIERLAGR